MYICIGAACIKASTEAPLSVADPLGASLLSRAQAKSSGSRDQGLGGAGHKKRALESALQLFPRSRSSVRSKLMQPATSQPEVEAESHGKGLVLQQRHVSGGSNALDNPDPLPILKQSGLEHPLCRELIHDCAKQGSSTEARVVHPISDHISDPMDRLDHARSKVIDLVSQHLGLKVPPGDPPAEASRTTSLNDPSRGPKQQHQLKHRGSSHAVSPALLLSHDGGGIMYAESASEDVMPLSQEAGGGFWDRISRLSSQQHPFSIGLSARTVEDPRHPGLSSGQTRSKFSSAKFQHRSGSTQGRGERPSLGMIEPDPSGSMPFPAVYSQGKIHSPALDIEGCPMACWTDQHYGFDDDMLDSMRQRDFEGAAGAAYRQNNEIGPADDGHGYSALEDGMDSHESQGARRAPMSLMEALVQGDGRGGFLEGMGQIPKRNMDFIQALEEDGDAVAQDDQE